MELDTELHRIEILHVEVAGVSLVLNRLCAVTGI
jgi:hypothetical protein